MRHQTYDFIFIGNEHPIKGMDVLELALGRLRKGSKTFAILGKVKGLKEKFKHCNQYDFFGEIKGMAKIMVLVRSSILILPSYHESFSIVTAEALHYGIPVIAFQLPTLQSIYKKGVVFVPYGDKELFFEYMMFLMKNKQELRRLKQSILEANYAFSWEKSAKKILEYIQN